MCLVEVEEEYCEELVFQLMKFGGYLYIFILQVFSKREVKTIKRDSENGWKVSKMSCPKE